MPTEFRSTDRLELSGIGDLVEGERPVARVSYRLLIRTPPGGLKSIEGTVTAAPGTSVDFFDLCNREAQLVLAFQGGEWECWVPSATIGANSAQLVNRGGVMLDEEKPRLDVNYTGAPRQSAAFDGLVDLLRHDCLPDFVGAVRGNSTRVQVTVSDPRTGAEWKDEGPPDEISVRFEAWLKKTASIVPRIP